MRLRIQFYYELADAPYVDEIFLQISEDTTIQELLEETGHGNGTIEDLSDYYPLIGTSFYGEELLPYLFVNGKAIYDIPFFDAKVIDFLYTHNITNSTIRIRTLPMAGGFGSSELIEVWNNIYPVLEQVAVLCTVTGVGLKTLFDYLRRCFVKRNQPPQVCFDIVFSRKQWNSSELSALLDIDIEKTKNLLALCDYKYNNIKQQYIQGENAQEIKEKLIHAKDG